MRDMENKKDKIVIYQTEDALFDVVTDYSYALDTLDSYDYQSST